MTPAHQEPLATIYAGDCVGIMAALPEVSVDAIVTDPPYGLEFMGKEWDSFRVDDPGTKRWRGDRASGSPGELTGPDEKDRHGKVGHGGQRPRTSRCRACGKRDMMRNPHACGDKASWAEEVTDPYAAPPAMLAFGEWSRRWALEAYRVLKPGGHLLAFGGSRTYHRLACAIEDAGFEVRDCLMWLYGSGFPKSLDVSKAIDKRGGVNVSWFGPWLREERQRRGITQKALAAHFPSKAGGLTGCVANWELGLNLPTPQQFNRLCEVLSLPFDRIEAAEREVTAVRTMSDSSSRRFAAPTAAQDDATTRDRLVDITAPGSAAAREWDGWGTALKPAHEPIILARKPLAEKNVAANVLAHGTGALNVDGCRIGGPTDTRRAKGGSDRPFPHHDDNWTPHASEGGQVGAGRWPANVLLGHSAGCEFVGTKRVKGSRIDTPSDHKFEAFADGGLGGPRPARGIGDADGMETVEDWRCLPDCPVRLLDEQSGEGRSPMPGSFQREMTSRGYPGGGLGQRRADDHDHVDLAKPGYGDTGGASRFFYTAKADKEDRDGSKHPTVKPVDLMKWLVTLVTPPAGVVLDPFLGSGTTVYAARELGIRSIGIEKDPGSVQDAIRRLRQGQLL